MGYWDRKAEMTDIAKAHTLAMSNLFEEEINNSINNSIVYYAGSAQENPTSCMPSSIKIQNLVSETACAVVRSTNPNKKICVLNFSSYKHPGGKFIEGSSAQEESLCHASTLYNCLKRFDKTFYEPHRQPGASNRALYENEAIYLPDVIFTNAKPTYKVDVLTCAAPNWTAANNYAHVPYSENYEVLESRIKFIKAIMEEQKVDIAILGAYGAGVFGQDPVDVAKIFNDVFKYTTIPSIVYAIPRDLNTHNYNAFISHIEVK